jgi:thioredoxin reductase (NADPH)
MAKPVILIVDDEVSGLQALQEALTRRFGADYDVIARGSAHEALELLAGLKARCAEIALVIADQWMPEMEGVQLLGRAHRIDRGAKRALLVAWGDRRSGPTILEGCAFGKLDNYLLKPFSPPEVHLYPMVEEFLSEWTQEYRPPLELVRIVAEEPSWRAHEIREVLSRSMISFGYYRAGTPEADRLLDEVGLRGARLPAVIVHEGPALSDPTNAQIADALGVTSLRGRKERQCDLAIVGAGPAGLAAAVYAASEGVRTLVIERETFGGQAGTSSLIRNYLGFPRGISGAELAQRAYQQAWLFGTKYVFGRDVASLEAIDGERVLTLSDGVRVHARAVLIATGASYRRLHVPSLERFDGAGVYYTAMRDTRVMRGREVHVIGGANSAGQAAVYLSQHARRVVLVVRGDSLASMSDYLVQEIRHAPNVEVRFRTEVVEGEGGAGLERIVLLDRDRGTRETVRTDAVFVLIGARPHTEWLPAEVRRDRHGFVLTGAEVAAEFDAPREPSPFETSLPGVFAAGDVRAGSTKRIASAVGDGAISVQSIEAYLAGGEVRPLDERLAATPELHPARAL